MRRAGILGVIAIASILVLGAAGVPAASYRDGDFLQFWLQPQALLDGASPYDPAWWSAMHARAGARPLFDEAVYPPYDALVFLPLALLPLSYAAAFWLVAQLMAVAAVSIGLARRISDRAGQAIFLAIAAAFQPVWLLAVGGNVTGFLFAALGGAYLAALDRRPLRCGALLGLLIVKPHPYVFLGVAALVFAHRSERRRLIQGALATAGPLVLVSLVLRPSWYGEWLPAALGLQGQPGSNATLWTIGRLVGADRSLLIGLGAAAVLAVIVAFASWALRTRPSLSTAIATAIPVSLAVAPHGWSYDQLQLLIPLAVLPEWIGASSVARRVTRGALALAGSAVPWLFYVIAFRRGGEELSVLTPLAVFVLLVNIGPRLDR